MRHWPWFEIIIAFATVVLECATFAYPDAWFGEGKVAWVMRIIYAAWGAAMVFSIGHSFGRRAAWETENRYWESLDLETAQQANADAIAIIEQARFEVRSSESSCGDDDAAYDYLSSVLEHKKAERLAILRGRI